VEDASQRAKSNGFRYLRAAASLLDVPRGPWARRLGQALVLKTFTVPAGNAEGLARMLREV
jgi:hypothetical protein